MTFRIGSRSGGGSRKLSSVEPASLEVKPTLKGAWTTQFVYSGFSGVERRNGPSGLAPFVVSMLRWGGDTPDIAKLTLFLADPGEVEADGSIVTSGDEETVGKLLTGDLDTAWVSPDHAEELADLYGQLPARGSAEAKGFPWRDWFSDARKIPVVAKPRGFDLEAAEVRKLTELVEADPVPDEAPVS